MIFLNLTAADKIFSYRNFMVTIPFSLRYSTLEPLRAISFKLRWQRTLKLHTTLLMTMSTSGWDSSLTSSLPGPVEESSTSCLSCNGGTDATENVFGKWHVWATCKQWGCYLRWPHWWQCADRWCAGRRARGGRGAARTWRGRGPRTGTLPAARGRTWDGVSHAEAGARPPVGCDHNYWLSGIQFIGQVQRSTQYHLYWDMFYY